jgi:hypothetical protein
MPVNMISRTEKQDRHAMSHDARHLLPSRRDGNKKVFKATVELMTIFYGFLRKAAIV